MRDFTRTIPLMFVLVLMLSVVLVAAQTDEQGDDPDAALWALLDAQGVEPLGPAPEYNPALLDLGQALFFDKILSGNRDIACATCHHPTFNGADGLALSLGTGSTGLGPNRVRDVERELIPRNAPDLYNRTGWSVLFWDGRVLQYADGSFQTPAGDDTPPDLIHPMAAQALFPVTSRDEMRGLIGDRDRFGAVNEVALLDDGDFAGIWDALMARVLAEPAYVEMLAAAYPGIDAADYGIQHVANAIGAFELHAFTFTESPWNRYLRGETDALSEQARDGALLFYGEAGCSACHSGTLMSDQNFHNIAVPQFGPGKGANLPYDEGRRVATGIYVDRFAFRTPSLHNVTLTGPYMHNGAYATLADVIAHKLDPLGSLANYAPIHLPADVLATLQGDPITYEMMGYTLAPLVQDQDLSGLTDAEIAALLAFLDALTDPAAADLDHLLPETVPSGLPVVD